MSPAARLLRFVAITLPVAVLVGLWSSDFFAGWDGRAVSVRPARSEEPPTRTVSIAQDDGWFEREWPSELVATLGLPIDPSGIPPLQISEDRPSTTKKRFGLHFLVEGTDGFQVVPTTRPQSVGLALLVWAALIALRNMAVAGVPWSLTPRERYLPAAQAPVGQVAVRGKPAGPKKTHPSPRGRH